MILFQTFSAHIFEILKDLLQMLYLGQFLWGGGDLLRIRSLVLDRVKYGMLEGEGGGNTGHT